MKGPFVFCFPLKKPRTKA